jgi:hypothetical protein
VAPAEQKTACTSRSPSPPLRRGNGGRPRRRGAGALWGAVRAQTPNLMNFTHQTGDTAATGIRRKSVAPTCWCMAMPT